MSFTVTANVGQVTPSGASPFAIGTAAGVGDLMIVGVVNELANSLTISSISDTFSTTYSSFVFSGGGNTYAIVYGFLAGTGANTMTLTWSSGSTSLAVYTEFTGSSVSGATVDGAGQGVNGSGAATGTTTPPITTAGTDDLVINYIWNNGDHPIYASPWNTAQSAYPSGGIGYQADVAAGTYTPNATFAAGGVWGSLCLAFTAGVPAADPNTLRTLSSPRLV